MQDVAYRGLEVEWTVFGAWVFLCVFAVGFVLGYDGFVCLGDLVEVFVAGVFVAVEFVAHGRVCR